MMDSGMSAVLLGAFIYFSVAGSLYVTVASWIVYTKAGEPGWATLVPIYNLVVMHRIAGKPGWWVLLYFIPIPGVNVIVSMVVWTIVQVGLSESFGRGTGFTVGLLLVPFVFVPILAFNDIDYQGA